MAVVVFFHAHPDDEAIFTGGTIARLSDAGHRVVVVVATGGELGARAPVSAPAPGPIPAPAPEPAPLRSSGTGVVGYGPAEPLAWRRRRETFDAAALLGVARVEFLGYHDSGLAGDPANRAPGALSAADPAEVGHRLAAVLLEERATTLVTYDDFGIYGHPDHVQVHDAGREAAAEAGIETVYEATVDREYLHFVETHLVEEAILAGDLGLARSNIGVPTVMVTTSISVAAVLDRKRAAMAAHASQIPESTSALQLGLEQFAAVYGWEWFIRRGPTGPLDALA